MVILHMSRRHAHMVALLVSVVVLVVAPLVLALAMSVHIIADASIFPVVLIAHVNRRWLLIAIMFDSPSSARSALGRVSWGNSAHV